jgi:hypothetical protein
MTFPRHESKTAEPFAPSLFSYTFQGGFSRPNHDSCLSPTKNSRSSGRSRRMMRMDWNWISKSWTLRIRGIGVMGSSGVLCCCWLVWRLRCRFGEFSPFLLLLVPFLSFAVVNAFSLSSFSFRTFVVWVLWFYTSRNAAGSFPLQGNCNTSRIGQGQRCEVIVCKRGLSISIFCELYCFRS